MVEELIDGKLTLNQPAGHLESGESLIEAAIRETLEETAWTFQPNSVVGIYRWLHQPTGNTYMRHCFSGNAVKFNPDLELDSDIEQAVWLSYDEIMTRQAQFRSPLVRDCLNDYLAGERYPLTLLHN